MEDDDLQKLLRKNIELSQEILSYVKSINRQFMLRRFFMIIKWGLIIGLLVFGFIQIQPYLDPLAKMLQNVSGILQQLPGVLPTGGQ